MKTFGSLRALAFFGAGMALAPSAYAQEAPEPTPDTDAASVEDDSVLIVVTAQGREQELSDVPVAVSAVSADQLAKSGTNDIRELNQVAPSLLVSSTGNEANGSARIRGIGTVGDNPGLESSVAVFVDGVYRSRSGNALSELGPLDRVEILRGPQGTLGGRNASAGLISIYTAPPEFEAGGYGYFTYGNFDAIRAEAGVNIPLGTTVAARVDGVYFERDGFYNDVNNGGTVNDRDRYLVRGQLLFEPSDDLSFRVVADYSKKDEACCAATFVQPDFAPLARVSPGLDTFARPLPGAPALTSTDNPIINVLLGLGQDPRALTQSTFNRDIYVTPGRSYDGETEDYGVSGELNWSFGDVNFTSITGYREYSNTQGSDTDYTQVDILYRAPGDNAGARAFETFTQEFRLNGSLFNDRFDWLIGAYYADEQLQTRDNLRFGSQYGTFASCRIAIALAPTLGPTTVNPGNANCLGAGAQGALIGDPANPLDGAFGPAGDALVNGLNILSQIRDRGSTMDVYNQNSRNFALFTHNIFAITDTVDLTLGARYTNERKEFDATFGNDNIFCPQQRALQNATLLNPTFLANFPAALRPTFQGLGGGLVSLSCQGNSTSELDGVSIDDEREEDQFTGTAILSWKPTDDLLLYGSYSRGYKAGGFNLDRSALQASPVVGNPAVTGSADNLQFEEETVTAYEIGAKYAKRDFSLSLAAFRQEFSNFQLNTFNGSVFLVQNVNACGTDLGGADTDASAATGSCNADDVEPGVISEGVELELALNPIRDFGMTLGLTYADTKYQENLIGNDTGAPLDPALRLLPGDNLSNAPEITATTSFSWTPRLGDGPARGLVFVNARMVDDYNTGSDLLYGKEQDSFFVMNARVGVTDIADAFSVEAWVQNLTDTDYTQVAFNTPFVAPQQTYSAYLAEPRTYGVTVRAEF
ncbi:TonB-dependent receptor [Qipengyuania sp. JC766]|uniref:TonB-dependent receptor n=1 Tax=Qipengyuania sp. JC766 TaxID=3232139 RepID=UPI00345AFEC2